MDSDDTVAPERAAPVDYTDLPRLLASGVLQATLECYGPPSRGQVWMLGAERTGIGRAGRRPNQVEVAEPSLSRAHASLQCEAEGFRLECETGSSPTLVNGLPVAMGESRRLADQDLLRLGSLLFRFRLAPPERRGLRIYSLGTFEVEGVPDTAWRTGTARYLLARLAAEWPRPVALAPLRELFWPEGTREQARKNLNWALGTLKTSLGVEEPFVRTTQTVQLSSQIFGWHDLTELREHLLEGRHRPERLRQALELYRGPYLEGCYLDWALRQRDALEQELVEAGLRLLRETPADLELGRRLLALDGCCQEACGAVMRTLREQGRAEEAVRLYDGCRRNLAQLELQPSLELEREHQLSLLNL